MPFHMRCEGDVVILSNFGRLMNDPRHFDASGDVRAMLDQGYRKFILELGGVGTMGASGLGLLMTLTRLVRRQGGEAVLANLSQGMKRIICDIYMDSFWEMFEDLEEARAFLGARV